MTFCELKISIDSTSNQNSISQLLIDAFELGYDRIVLCQTENLQSSNLNSGKKNKKQKSEENCEKSLPTNFVSAKRIVVKIPDQLINRCRQSNRQFRVYSRLNVIVHDNQSLHYLKRAEIQREFDLISVQPSNKEVFLHLVNLTTIPFELVVLDPSDNEFLPFPTKSMRAAAQRGIHFELIYNKALRDSIERRNLLAFGRALSSLVFKRGNSIVLSSNATNILEIRSPHDLVQIVKLFGFDEQISNRLVRQNPLDVLARSFSRRKTFQGSIWLEEKRKNTQSPSDQPFVATETIQL